MNDTPGPRRRPFASTVRRFLDVALRPYRLVVLRLVLLIWPRTRVGSFELLDFTFDREAAALAPRFAAAMDLIRERDPHRFARIIRDLKRLIVIQAGAPEYVHPARACVFDLEFAKMATVKQLALSVVHEATHARLWKQGFRYGHAERSRIERVCVGAELAFARRLGNGNDLQDEVLAKLQTHWWSADEEHQRRLRQLRALGKSNWYMKAYNFLRRP